MTLTVHATCVAFGDAGVLLRGASGSGKSDLALRALDQGARLVADDRVRLRVEGNRIMAAAPAELFGMIEIRGLGILRIDAAAETTLALVADLGELETIERMPERRDCTLLGLSLPWIELDPFQPSALAKLRFALLAAQAPDRIVS